MARFEIWTSENAPLGEAADGNALLQLGMRYAIAESPDDRMTAHKWFNIAAMRGSAEAVRLRREIAAEMSPAEIAAAQRAARDWVSHH
jgi:TPR repeat protein